MVLDADFIEEISEPEIDEISEPEIELEEVEEVSLLPGPSSCPKTYLGLNRNLLGMVNNQLNYLDQYVLVFGQICFGHIERWGICKVSFLGD